MLYTIWYAVVGGSGVGVQHEMMQREGCVLPVELFYRTCSSMDGWMYGHHILYSKSMDQPGKVASPARGQLNRENSYFTVTVGA